MPPSHSSARIEPSLALARDLRTAGFAAAANDVVNGRRGRAWAVEHVRRCALRRNEEGRRKAQEFLDRWELGPYV